MAAFRNMPDSCSRRDFLKQSALAASSWPLVTMTGSADAGLPDVHIFSKHLQFLNYADMADAAATMGFNGVDLTIRPDGHVKPDRVEDDLPKAADALRKAGLSPKLMTTTVGDATNPLDKRVLVTASELGFQLYRMKWYQYNPEETIPASIQAFQRQLKALSELNTSLKLVGCYQNHAGLLVGSSVWEIWEMLKMADPDHMGAQYDIRHATVEGGESWSNGLRLLLPQIRSIAIKDFYWEKKKSQDGTLKWAVQDVPLGEGMVDFKTYFNVLKKSNLRVPVSLHIEYPMGGAEHGAAKLSIPQNELFTAMKRDLLRLKQLWESA